MAGVRPGPGRRRVFSRPSLERRAGPRASGRLSPKPAPSFRTWQGCVFRRPAWFGVAAGREPRPGHGPPAVPFWGAPHARRGPGRAKVAGPRITGGSARPLTRSTCLGQAREQQVSLCHARAMVRRAVCSCGQRCAHDLRVCPPGASGGSGSPHSGVSAGQGSCQPPRGQRPFPAAQMPLVSWPGLAGDPARAHAPFLAGRVWPPAAKELAATLSARAVRCRRLPGLGTVPSWPSPSTTLRASFLLAAEGWGGDHGDGARSGPSPGEHSIHAAALCGGVIMNPRDRASERPQHLPLGRAPSLRTRPVSARGPSGGDASGVGWQGLEGWWLPVSSSLRPLQR